MHTSKAAASTLAGHLWTRRDGARGQLRNLALAFLGSLFVAACAQIQVPMWPVPVTMQTFAVVVVGMAFGARLGAATLALYVAQGAIGLPVFANFTAGPAVLMGPTGGYIVGFVLAAWIAGSLAERGWDRKVWTTALAMLAGNAAIYLPGLAWLTILYAGALAPHIQATGAAGPFGAAIATGLMPFLVGDALKIALAAAAMPVAWRLVQRFN